ncbi:hypothetical protein B1207_04370 [Legionella quinlivanii]|uniref:ATP synthase subunit I n=1 Tax=Legionella quinlivanii TaxID=45073 RepID=A0A364LL16_9GAMM|nr:ATP synthase subunit I [Legionella quinlivanii]RAP37415.1 hypothetical protein B1207_04370 [Legionella quinlivanii]
MKLDNNVNGVKKLQEIQLLLILIIVFTTLLIKDREAGISAFLGGMIALLPSLLFAKLLFKYRGARAARQIVKNFYLGEFIKIGSSIFLFVLVFSTYKVQPLAFFLTYIVVVISHWFSPLLIDNQRNRPESD